MQLEIPASALDILRNASASTSGSREQEQPEAEVVENDLDAFPELAWRGIFVDYREAMANATEASDVFHFAALWAGAAVSLGRRTWMFAGEQVFPNAYLLLFGETGDKKTTAQRMILNHNVLPANILVIRNLGSTEGLADAFKREDGADSVVLSFWEEVTSVFARGRWSGSTILEFITETFDCPPEWGLKYRKDPITIEKPTPTILSGTTLAWFWKNARAEDFHGGFGNRFGYLTGPKKAPNPNPTEPGGAALQRVREALERLSGIHPVQARFSHAAIRLWDRFYIKWESDARPGLYGAATKRIHVYIRKLAMVYAALEETLPEITLDQLKASIAVGVYMAECARVLVEAQHAAFRPEGQIEQRFLDWLKSHDGATRRTMQQTLTKVAGSCDAFNRTLAALVRSDLIEIRENRVYLVTR